MFLKYLSGGVNLKVSSFIEHNLNHDFLCLLSTANVASH